MIFVDTGYFLGLLQPGDPLQQRARIYTHAVSGVRLTTEFIFIEVAATLSSPCNRRRVAPFIAALRVDPLYEIVPASSSLFEAGLLLCDARPDKEWSLTDCISFVLMQERGISRALAFDHHFEQAGFEALLRREP